MPLKTRKDYERANEVVGAVINDWNPYGLIGEGGRPDEFGPEVAELVTWIPKIRTKDDAVQSISAVFSKWFEPKHFRPHACAQIGASLHAALVRNGFVPRELDN